MGHIYIYLENGIVCRTDNFFIKKRISVADIDIFRYQPTYGIGKEASSLYIFSKGQETATLTMTKIWFGEKKLSQFVKDLKKTNPQIKFDDEALSLIK